MSAPPTVGALPAREVSKVLMDILQAEMDLDATHCLLGDQKWDIPADSKLFVVIFDDAGPPFGACDFLDTDPTSPFLGLEVQQSSVLHHCRVDIMSFDAEARTRKEEVGMALASLAAQQAQGQHKMQIGRPQAPVNATATEEAGRLFRYVTSVNVTALHQKVKAPPPGADYYDEFNGAQTPGTALPPEVKLQ